MINQTYLINQLQVTIESPVSAEKQFRFRINELRKRTKVLLRNHSWQKFFLNDQQQSQQTQTEQSSIDNVCRRGLAASILATYQTQDHQHTDKNASFERSKLKMMSFATPLGAADACGTTPNKKRKTKKISFKLVKTSTSSSRQDNNNIKKCKSMTFIGDLVSTSTPTRTIEQPLSSTPNTSTHNAHEHHPSRTIRSKKRQRFDMTDMVETPQSIKIVATTTTTHAHQGVHRVCHANRHRCCHNGHHHHHHHHNHHHGHNHHNIVQHAVQHNPIVPVVTKRKLNSNHQI